MTDQSYEPGFTIVLDFMRNEWDSDKKTASILRLLDALGYRELIAAHDQGSATGETDG